MLRLASGIILAVPVIAAVASPMMKRATAFFNPVNGGGSWLDNAGDGFGEPLNVSVSTHPVLSRANTDLFGQLRSLSQERAPQMS